MTALLDAAAVAERLATQAEMVDNMSDEDADALRLLAKHARESAKRVTIIMGADEANVLLDGEEISELDERDPKDDYIFGIGLVELIVRSLGGTIDIVDGRYSDDSPIAELVSALDKIGFRVPPAADWTQEINLRQVERLDSADVKAAVDKVRAALAAKGGSTS